MPSSALQEMRHWLEPLAATVYFNPEPNNAYIELGLNIMEGYFCSRSSALGKIDGSIVASVFGFFKPELAITSVDTGWSKTDPATLIQVRTAGAAAALRRLLDKPVQPRVVELLLPAMLNAPSEGRPLFVAWRNVEMPDDPVEQLWRVLDLYREHRFAGHLAAWTSTGIGPREASILSEAWWGLPPKTYARTFGWTTEELDEGLQIIEATGLTKDGKITSTGKALRDEVENLTDRSQAAIERELGETLLAELTSILRPLCEQVLDKGGYPLRFPLPDERPEATGAA